MVVTSFRSSAGSPALPFDEQLEDQTNEDFFREIQQEYQHQQALQKLNQESLKKFKEFEKWFKIQQRQEDKKKNKNKKKTSLKVNVNLMQPKQMQLPDTIQEMEQSMSHKEDLVDDQDDELPIEPQEGEEALSEDIYSLLYTARFCSQAFYFAMFVFMLQETLLLLILWDMVDLHQVDTNMLRIPPGVPIRVNVAQAISMILIVATILADSGDLTNGILNLVAGYDRTVLTKNPHANCFKWFLAFSLQTLAGLSMTVVLFLLVLQSTTVIGLALNFAALVRSHSPH